MTTLLDSVHSSQLRDGFLSSRIPYPDATSSRECEDNLSQLRVELRRLDASVAWTNPEVDIFCVLVSRHEHETTRVVAGATLIELSVGPDADT